MLDLLTKREEFQRRATLEQGRRFANYDINCVAVLIGQPESLRVSGSDDPIELLFDQLRVRRLAAEQKARKYGLLELSAAALLSVNPISADTGTTRKTHAVKRKCISTFGGRIRSIVCNIPIE